MVCQEVKILNVEAITAEQITGSLLAIPAFLPATVCTGYLAGWVTNLHGFRQRSLVERIFWSVPLSVAISPIASVLIGRFLSLTAVVVFFMASAAVWLATLAWEWRQLRRSGGKWIIGWRPLGGTALLLAVLWIVVAVLSLVDFQSNHHLFMSISIFDHAPRVNWIESVLRTGVPPANSLYWYKHPASMRNYYFWYVLCATVAQMAHLPARAVLIASCAWAGFVLAALIGLYLKHFLAAGVRLRRQFLVAIFLLTVTGLDICAVLWNLLYLHRSLPLDFERWSKDPIISWLDTLLCAPNHIASLVCCMLAFLLAWMARKDDKRKRTASVLLIAATLASAFGLSIYVAFAFFLVILAWAIWQATIERMHGPALLLAAGGAGAVVLLFPYLWELTHNSSDIHGGSVFAFAVREMLAPDSLLASRLFLHFAISHPVTARSVANLVLLAPGYVLELGFFCAVFLTYMVPAWRDRAPLTPEQRSLLFIAAATIPIMSLVRSGVLNTNDFGWRAALLLQFVLVLFGSELLTAWHFADHKCRASTHSTGLLQNTPHWLRSVASFALIFGILSTVCQALVFRFALSLAESPHARASHDSVAGNLSHNAYISAIGYAQLDAYIPHDAIVQFNPSPPNPFWADVDLVGIDHQTAIAGDQPWCGSELGGDPSGCPAMAAAIDSLFNGATAEQARTMCRRYNIQYLVARIYDPAWKDKGGWVWTLQPVVSDEEFRALDCR